MEQTFLIWDLGATKCGIAQVTANEHGLLCKQHYHFSLRDYQSLDNLIDAIEARLAISHDQVLKILIAGAGQFDGECLILENPYPYEMHFAQVARQRNWLEFKVVHDYVPVLCATFTPHISDTQHVLPIRAGQGDPWGRHVVLGVGTGLGLKDGARLKNGGLWIGCNEMGHIGIYFPPLVPAKERDRHQALMAFLINQVQGQVSFETILSGQGLCLLHQFCTGQQLTADAISQLLNQGQADATAEIFAWYLGLYIAGVQLSFMPLGGIWLSGGVLKKNPLLVKHPALFQGIESHPAYQHIRQRIPLALITSDELAYLGGAWYVLNQP